MKTEESGIIGEGYQWASLLHLHTSTSNVPSAKGGLKENNRAVNQLLAIVGSEDNIEQDEKWSIIIILKMVTVNRDSTVESRGRYS